MGKIFPQKSKAARIPTEVGEFQLYIYHDEDENKEHLALVKGDIVGKSEVLVRIHSECYTGDVLGSTRCDCGTQLQRAMHKIATRGAGILIYLRQEGRGIGLLEKLRAYNLQDQGYDTVEANLLLGHQADARDYSIAAYILQDFAIKSVQLLTNNPKKIDSLQSMGIPVTVRHPLYGAITTENAKYVQTKIERFHHFPPPNNTPPPEPWTTMPPVQARLNKAAPFAKKHQRPYITLSYAQTVDGCLTNQAGRPLALSNPFAQQLTHRLRAAHDALLVGINTVLADDPQLTVRLVNGSHPQPLILDSHLRFPRQARLLHGPRPPWIMTTTEADKHKQQALETQGAQIFRLPADECGRVSLPAMLTRLTELGLVKLMVEGGSEVLTSFIKHQLADQLLLTTAPLLVGGLQAISYLDLGQATEFPKLESLHYELLDDNLIMRGDFSWPTP